MEFTFETVYDQKAMTAMARALRRTVRKKHSRRSHIIGWIVVALGALLLWNRLSNGGGVDLNAVVTGIAIVLIVLVFLFEDALNGYFARKRNLPGLASTTVTFTEDGYRSVTEMGNTEWFYDKIEAIAETGDYFVFLFSKSHAQLYDKRRLTGGSAEDFRAFITEKTGREIAAVK